MENKRKEKKKTEIIIVRCTPDEKEKIKINAGLSHLTITDYVLSKALEKNIKTAFDHELITTLLQLKADMARCGNLFKISLDHGYSGASKEYLNALNSVHEVSEKIGQILEEKLK